MSSCSSASSPTISPLYRNNFSSSDSFPSSSGTGSFDSPAAWYSELTRRVDKVISDEDRKELLLRKPPIRTDSTTSRIPENQPDPLLITSSAIAGTRAIAGFGIGALRFPLMTPPIYSSPETTPSILSSSSELMSQHRLSFALIGTVCLLAGTVTYQSTIAYQPFAIDLKADICRAFHGILDIEISPEALLETVNGIITKKEQNWFFSRFFQNQNPKLMGYLYLTKGIALDSIGVNLEPDSVEALQYYYDAQVQYRTALSYKIHSDLHDQIRLAYARSLRLSKNPPIDILDQLNQIDLQSKFQEIASIERSACGKLAAKIMNRYQYPYDFLCPITRDVMVDPSYHIRERKIYYSERSVMEAWLDMKNNETSPLSGSSLKREELSTDVERRNLIQRWHSTKLKAVTDS